MSSLPPPYPPSTTPHHLRDVDSASPAPYPQRTSEQHDMVRRRSAPVAVGAFICAVGGIVMLLMHGVNQSHPPLILAVNLSFCAMMMGIGIIFYARGTPGTRLATILSALALLIGFVGPLIYAAQTVTYRKAAEESELSNVQSITAAAIKYAETHHGNFPDDLYTLLTQGYLPPTALHSFYAAKQVLNVTELAASKDPGKDIDEHSDYQYFGRGLKLPAATTTVSTQPFAPTTAPAPTSSGSLGGLDDVGNATGSPITSTDPYAHIIVATARDPIMRIHLAVSFASGDPRFITLDEAETMVENSNKARRSLSFPEMRPPESVGKALEVDHQK